MSLDDARRRLQAAESEVVVALLRDKPAPPGFDPRGFERARAKLLAKRAWVAARRAERRPGWLAWLGRWLWWR